MQRPRACMCSLFGLVYLNENGKLSARSNIPFFCVPAAYCLYRGQIYDMRVKMIWISMLLGLWLACPREPNTP